VSGDAGLSFQHASVANDVDGGADEGVALTGIHRRCQPQDQIICYSVSAPLFSFFGSRKKNRGWLDDGFVIGVAGQLPDLGVVVDSFG
jgi:hypothetical protein